MSESSIHAGSLVLYKIHPAVVKQVGEKIEIQLEAGKSKKVRGKDVILIHPGPISSLSTLTEVEGNVEEAWELLQGEQPSLSELAELVYGDFTPVTAWASWQLLDDGLYFSGQVDAITVNDSETVEAVQSARDSKAREAEEWEGFLLRVKQAQLEDEDRKRLAEVERVALGKTERSRILSSFDVTESAEAAHQFLIRCGYWPAEENPWPRRMDAMLDEIKIGVPGLADENRMDLTHLTAWAIDDVGNQDPDDAISIDGDYLWVHVADVAALVRPDGHLDMAARERGSNLYLPERVHTMLPGAITTLLGLGLAEESPALSIGFHFDGEKLSDIRVVPSRVRVTRTTYDDVNEQMEKPEFAAIAERTQRYRANRLARNAAQINLPEASVRVVDGEVLIRSLPKLASRDMVTDAMLMAGEAAARFASANNIAIPYAMQPEPSEIRQPELMSEMYAYRRLFKPSNTVLQGEPHFGLGLEMYARTTSPLRRYADLLVHQQLRAFVTGKAPQVAEAMLERIAMQDNASRKIRKAERMSNQHWKLVHMSRNPDWQGEAVIMAMDERKATVVIPELAMEAKIRMQDSFELDKTVRLAVREVNVPSQNIYFRVL